MNFPTRPHHANVPTLTEVIEFDPEGDKLLPMPVVEVSEAQLSQRILTDVQRQIDSMLEFRLRESMQPLLAQFTETLMQDLRDELSRTMRDVVTRAVAQEAAKLRNNR
ncbi:hypothetical protein [Aquabacterium sp.]|uniref:hypothetical protein n=1 Tax=Aquabacterium sp. TaxID=1872578 RepID=UPI0019BC7036|nr:hypothetical protein [Aquabacterium sp.]MBC7699345.1 hypothetical protein [Aquabacterium sp.]